MAELNPVAPKTSFLKSTVEGIKGYIKGGIAGAVIGAVVIGSIAAMAGAFFPGVGIDMVTASFSEEAAQSLISSIGGVGATAATIGTGASAALAAIGGALSGAGLFGAIGGFAGMATGVVKSRERQAPTAEDVVNVAKISFAQGVAVGHNMEQFAQAQEKHNTKWRDKIGKEQASVALAERPVLN